MPVFKDPKKLAEYLKKAADALQAETIITTQAQLAARQFRRTTPGGFVRAGLLLKVTRAMR